ncbi:hypothetical protein FACS1894151_02300 [Spirochaetia bacterium]|nr:hypothetical protein FACS1894151_02300 [Spirochaetia bacterium]
MKNRIIVLLLSFFCTGLFAQNISLDQAVFSASGTVESRLPQGSKVAVLAFSSTSQNFSDYIIDELAIALAANNKMMVIDRQYTDVIRKELNIQMEGDVSDDDIKRVGHQLGAQFVITGSLVDIGNAYRFRLVAIDVETAVRTASVSLSINIADPQVVFLLTGQRQASPAQVTVPAPTATAPVSAAPGAAPSAQTRPAQSAVPPGQSAPAGFVHIQGGTFMMGSSSFEEGRSSNEALHQVTVSGFLMARYEVTQQEYETVTLTNPSSTKGPNLPVTNVNWYSVIVYCNKRSIAEGLTPVYSINGSTDPESWGTVPTGNNNAAWNSVTWNRSANGYRLPTEAEWEYACRAGTTTAYNTGAGITRTQAKFSGGSPVAVGSFEPNPWLLYDMHGNVAEWCWDWYGNYSSGSQTDPLGASSGSSRVYRGGSTSSGPQFLRSARRESYPPNTRFYVMGFRVVRSSL